MVEKIKLTKGDVERAQAPTDRKLTYYYFEGKPGLVLQVTKAGTKSFQVYKRINKESAPYRKTLGQYPGMHPDKAWSAALAELSALANEGDPRPAQKEQEQIELTFGELFNEYLNKYAKEHTKTAGELEKSYDRYFRERWHWVKVSSIKRMDIQNWITNVKEGVVERGQRKTGDGRHTAKRNFESFRAILNWGRTKELVKIEGDPCKGIDLYKTKARERFLQPGDEYNRFIAAVESETNPVIKHFVKLCLFTGMRCSNVMAMRWDEISWDLATWTIADSKNNDSQTVNLTIDAMALLQDIYNNFRTSDVWVLPGTGRTGHIVEPKKAWALIIKRANISDLRIHDLRRTVGSYMAIQGVDSKIIGKALGHRSIQATAVYARLTQDPVRLAMENAQAAFGDPSKLLKQNNTNDDNDKRKGLNRES